MHSTFSTVTFIFGWVSFIVSISATISLIILIETKSRKEFGGYKNFLRIYSIYAFCFAMIDWLVQPMLFKMFMDSDTHFILKIECLIWVIPWLILSKVGSKTCYSKNALRIPVLYCGCFIASSSFLSLNFIYRYVSCCRKHLLKHFQGCGLFLIFLYCSFPFIIWSLCVFFLFGPTPEKTVYLNLSTIEKEGVDLTGKPYVGPMCRHFTNTSNHNFGGINWPTMGAMLGLCGFQALFYNISLICGLRTYQYNQKLFKMSQLSKNLYKIQMQLLRAIVIQAVVPLISVYVPPAFVIGGSMFGVYVGDVGYFAAMSISLYPPLDSLVFLLSIRDYREALFCWRRNKNKVRGANSSTRNTTDVGSI